MNAIGFEVERIQHDLLQGSPEWIEFRASHHGASEAAAMLGLSKHTTRSELMLMKKTGTRKEFSEWVQKNVLDYGHEVEALARPLVEIIIGEPLYPVTWSIGKLSASCDGLTIGDDVAFEHKQWNESLVASVANGILPEDHMAQCQQILLVTGAENLIFVVSDGTAKNLVHMIVLPDAAWFQRIIDGWAQFEKDMAEYVMPDAKPAIVADVVSLPSVFVNISGQIAVQDNFKEFEIALRNFLENKLIREPQTDQDFADLDAQIKTMKKAEDALSAAETQMLAQIQSIDEAKRQKDMLSKLVRDNRLMAEKLLESEKLRRKSEKIESTRKLFLEHLAKLQNEITQVRLDYPVPDFLSATKGLKTLDSMQERLNTALANAKIAVDAQAADLRTKLAWLDENASEHRALLADLQQLIAKPMDDFQLAVKSRIESHNKAEAAKIEAKLEAERQKIRAEEEIKAKAEAKANLIIEHESVERPRISIDNAIENKPTSSRPSDADIVNVLSNHFKVNNATVISWLEKFIFN
ncbi:MAG: YqaJ viral recombinase family protein [Candidatus Saccharimonadales bacterium]